MSQLTGLVFDPYDDTTGEVLRSIVPDPSSLPSFVKEAHRISPDEASNVPDDNYALVLIKEGQKLRKFATVDKGNTALSVMYLLKQAHLLPPKAVKIAAHNLLEACDRFGMEAPLHLKIAASSGISGLANGLQIPEMLGETTLNPQLGKIDPADPAIKNQTNYAGSAGSNFIEPSLGPKERLSGGEGAGIDREKTAEADPATLALLEHGASTRQQNFRTSPYVDMADWEPGANLVEKTASATLTLLRGKYPIDSYDQVKTASAYFEVNTRKIDPRDRRQFCVKLASRMEELGIQVPESIEKYASPGYGADVDSYVGFRRGYVSEEFHPSLDLLLEKRAQVSPDTFAEALCEFDKMARIHYYWDSEIPDPWYSTFGPSLTKIAEKDWAWDEQGVHIHEADLQHLATNGGPLLSKTFGDDFHKEFSKAPKTFFNALPTPQKLILGRMAMDRDAGTGTE